MSQCELHVGEQTGRQQARYGSCWLFRAVSELLCVQVAACMGIISVMIASPKGAVHEEGAQGAPHIAWILRGLVGPVERPVLYCKHSRRLSLQRCGGVGASHLRCKNSQRTAVAPPGGQAELSNNTCKQILCADLSV